MVDYFYIQLITEYTLTCTVSKQYNKPYKHFAIREMMPDIFFRTFDHLILSFFSTQLYHEDVIKWKHFPRYWAFVRGIHGSPVNSPHKGQWRGALMFTLICVWINGCVNNREAGDLRCYCAHYGVTVMPCTSQPKHIGYLTHSIISNIIRPIYRNRKYRWRIIIAIASRHRASQRMFQYQYIMSLSHLW